MTEAIAWISQPDTMRVIATLALVFGLHRALEAVSS